LADHLYTYDNPPSERDLARICHVLADGGVIAYPTDHNWAFGCDAADVRAIDRIRMLKPAHPKDRPFALLCADISMAAQVGHIDSDAYSLLKKAWPGPYTVLITAHKTLARQIKDKRKTVGIRVPNTPLVLAIVARYGKPLASTSVPVLRGGSLAKHGYEVFEEFGHGLDLVVDLGAELDGQESTMVDLTDGTPRLVRLGIGDPKLFDL